MDDEEWSSFAFSGITTGLLVLLGIIFTTDAPWTHIGATLASLWR